MNFMVIARREKLFQVREIDTTPIVIDPPNPSNTTAIFDPGKTMSSAEILEAKLNNITAGGYNIEQVILLPEK